MARLPRLFLRRKRSVLVRRQRHPSHQRHLPARVTKKNPALTLGVLDNRRLPIQILNSSLPATNPQNFYPGSRHRTLRRHPIYPLTPRALYRIVHPAPPVFPAFFTVWHASNIHFIMIMSTQKIFWSGCEKKVVAAARPCQLGQLTNSVISAPTRRRQPASLTISTIQGWTHPPHASPGTT